MSDASTSNAEPVSVPSYEEFCAMQDDDYDWWDWILDDQCTYLDNEYGIDIEKKDVCFDLYRRTCASKGTLRPNAKFFTEHHDVLMNASAVMTEVLRERLYIVTWDALRNENGNEYRFDDEAYGHDYVFASGLFVGLPINELIEAEGANNVSHWIKTVEGILNDAHYDIIKALECEDEYRKSTEEYEEWIRANY